MSSRRSSETACHILRARASHRNSLFSPARGPAFLGGPGVTPLGNSGHLTGGQDYDEISEDID